MRVDIGDKIVFSNIFYDLTNHQLDIKELRGISIDSRKIKKGDIFIALKGENFDGHNFIDEAVKTMTLLNKGAAEAMNSIGVHACTDITGYGLLGHLLEMCQGSKISATLDFNTIPLIEGVYELAQKKFIPGGTKQNLEYVSSHVNFSKSISEEQKYILSDAQTSGGLLISVEKNKAEALQNLLSKKHCLSSNMIGQISNPTDISIYVN